MTCQYSDHYTQVLLFYYNSHLASSLACYDCPIRRLEGDKGEGRSSGNGDWLTPLGYDSEMMIGVLPTTVTFQDHKQTFSPICFP